MINSYSLIRPNEGGYFLTNEYKARSSEPCERKGVLLAERIGHRISHRVVVKGQTNHIQSRRYTIEKGGEIHTGTVTDLIDKVFKNVHDETVRKAERLGKKLKGWTVRIETE